MPYEFKIGQPGDVLIGTHGDYIVDFDLGEDSDDIAVVQMMVGLTEDDHTGSDPFELLFGIKRRFVETGVSTLARAYLENFANNFPPTTQGAPSAGFASALRQVHARALDVVSSSAIRAPFGYGAQISTVMTRLETLGERIESTLLQQPAINADATWSLQIFEMIEGIRSLVAQIASDIPVHEKHLLRLADERDAIK
jgi:hypothetical protein